MPHRKEKSTYSLSENKVVRWVLLGIVGLGVLLVAAQLVSSLGSGEKTTGTRIKRIAVVLKGEKIPSDPVRVATGSEVYFIGPPNVEAEDGKGKRFPLHGEHGVTWSPYRLYGPKGDTVFVDIIAKL